MQYISGGSGSREETGEKEYPVILISVFMNHFHIHHNGIRTTEPDFFHFLTIRFFVPVCPVSL